MHAKNLLVLSVASLVAQALPSSAQAGGGSIVITDHKLNPALSSFQKELKTENKLALTKDPDSDSWKVFFVANLSKQAGSEDINVVFYDAKDAAKDKKAAAEREPVQAYPIRTKPTAKVLMSELSLKPEEGFKIGGKYQVLITRLINGKEDVYARTTLELKDVGEGIKAKEIKAPNTDTPGVFATDKPEKAGKPEKPDKAEKPGKAEKIDKAEKIE